MILHNGKTRSTAGMLRRSVCIASLFAAVTLVPAAEAAKKLVATPAVSAQSIGANTEASTKPAEAQSPVSISVDGETVFGSTTPADAERQTDVGLDKVDIQVKFDGLGVAPVLNISTWPIQHSYQPGSPIRFLASSNYPAWIAHSEIRIFEKGADLLGPPLYRIAVTEEGEANWLMPAKGPADLVYVLRVADDKGRYDETLPLSLARVDSKLAGHDTEGDKVAVAPGYGEDRTAFRNIPVYGGAITVYGTNIPDRHNVHVLGESVPVDGEHAFVIQRILPPGDHDVDVAVTNADAKGDATGLTFDRTVNIPSNEWFYVGLADFTLGRRFGSDYIEDVKPGEYDKLYSKGRLAFYLKGKIKGRYLLTAAADTGEGRVQDIIKGLDKKDPRQFLSRIDPEEFYPIYGDDSTSVEDAPTRGKFYVRLERGSSHVMWGNFKTNISGTTFLRNERALYGAGAVLRSESTTRDGEATSEVHAYAAQPGTMPAQDVFRGTGGSAYFLTHQDVTTGSETVQVEVRDPVSARVLSRRSLRFGFDYEVDYMQGLILLKAPLSSSTASTDVVRDGALGGAQQFLTVNYEYTPAASDVKGYSIGGRAQQWIGNVVRVGVTGQSEDTGPAKQKIYGADVLVRHSAGTFIEAEVAQSKGPGFGNNKSYDGGYTISTIGTSGVSGKAANAYRARARVNFEDLTQGRMSGEAGAYVEHKQAGFSSLDEQVTDAKTIWGADASVNLTQKSVAKVKFDSLHSDDGRREDEGNAEVAVAVTDKLTVTPGAKISNRQNGSLGLDTSDEGRRTDVGAEVRYAFGEQTSVYGFGQATVERNGSRRRNDRIGVGGEAPISDKVGVYGEISTGSLGVGGKAGVDYHPTADDHYYLGYKLDPDRADSIDASSPLTGNDLGAVVLGARHRYSERLTGFAEDGYDLFGRKKTLTQTYGVEYTPDAAWNLGAGVEVGKVKDDTVDSTGKKNSDFDRIALSASAAYHGEDFDGKLKGEYRRERSGDNTRNRDTYLLGAGLTRSTGKDWKFLANLDMVLSDATEDTLNGKYVEGTVGYAYRPVETDALNALFKYTFLYDLPGTDQVTVNGTTQGPAQRSNILSADVSYDLNKIVTLGAKYGLRYGSIKARDGSTGWERSHAQIGILRADLHVVNNWDALLEGRVLWNNDGTNVGVLAAVYRQINENFKIGAGYNFGRFSDDLRDLTLDDQGVFINAIGQF